MDFVRFAGVRAGVACGLTVVAGLLEGFGLTLLIPFLQIAGSAPGRAHGVIGQIQALLQRFGVEDRAQQLSVILVVFGMAMATRTLLNAKKQLLIAELELDYLNAKQFSVISTLSNAPWKSVVDLKHARITHLLSHDVYRVGQAATGLLESTVAVILLTVQFSIAMWISPVLTLAALGLLAIAAVLMSPFLRSARQVGEIVMSSHITLLNDASQFLGALKLAVSQNLQPRFAAEFSKVQHQVTEAELQFLRRRTRMRLRLTLAGVAVGVIVAIVGLGVLDMPAAALITVLVILSRMSAPANQFQAHVLEMVRALPAFDAVRALEAHFKNEAEANLSSAIPTSPAGDIRFDDVSYVHGVEPDRPSGVQHLDLTIPVGAFVGIAGPSGAGKTTFADLLVGLFEPLSGVITIGGAPVKLAALRSWRDRLAYVSQDPFLRNDTVRANLLWAEPNASEAALQRALKISGADLLIARLPLGMETIVGERGGLISGGERQRLAIARALLRDPQLLILDEATNAIDVAGERVLLQRLAALTPALTIVMIAHRMESLSLCDRVVVIDRGRVAREGRFEDLKAYLSDPSIRASLAPAEPSQEFD